jgi:hypothetical protein
MAVDYDLACRRDALGPLLAAAFLARKGCRVLLLPPRPEKRPEPGFLIPVVKGFPAELLADLVTLEDPPEKLLSCRDSAGALKGLWLGSPGLQASVQNSWPELEALWRLIDDCMRQNLEMPVASLSGTGRMLWLVIRNELLRGSRNLKLGDWLKGAGIDDAEVPFWHCLAPLLTLSRFADPPLLAFAYGATALASPDGWLRVAELKETLLGLLRRWGADFASEEEWSPVFDGKWYIGVGRNRQAARRSTVFLADSDPEALRCEVSAGDQRRDFKRQMELAEPGFVVYEKRAEGKLPETPAPYHLEFGDNHELSDLLLLGPEDRASGKRAGYRFRPAGGALAEGERSWGWTPRLPAMMGGGFLPLSRGFCRFYQVGWHNLPGFGLGGLVYAARQAAVRVWTHDLQKDPAALEGKAGG